ncbi:MAG TPA: hypothetical protein VKE24_16870 [Candidatus Acidoferrales bacterium]|nr:hypothetical protein [Candidatus Acidoferrales bacterium]
MSPIAKLIVELADQDPALREAAAAELSKLGAALADAIVEGWRTDPELATLLAVQPTVGVAVWPEHFERVRAAMGSPPLAEVPPDQDALEFEVHLGRHAHLDILTTKEPGESGAIARFLEKFGEGIQQVEYPTTNVDRAAEVLRAHFGLEPIHLEARPGAGGARVNFFLTRRPDGRKVLIELVEGPAEKPQAKDRRST